MKFKLLYFGDLKVNPKKRSQHIAEIRMKFHQQLKELLKVSPWHHLTEYMGPNAKKTPVITRHYNGIDFNPIITPALNLIAELEVQMFHPEIIGQSRADIDNRMKTLLDALRAPQTEHEVGENTPKNIGPIYCLLDDDHLVTKLTVNTSHFLNPKMFSCGKELTDADLENFIFLLIDVNIRVSEGTIENLPFMV